MFCWYLLSKFHVKYIQNVVFLRISEFVILFCLCYKLKVDSGECICHIGCGFTNMIERRWNDRRRGVQKQDWNFAHQTKTWIWYNHKYNRWKMKKKEEEEAKIINSSIYSRYSKEKNAYEQEVKWQRRVLHSIYKCTLK